MPPLYTEIFMQSHLYLDSFFCSNTSSVPETTRENYSELQILTCRLIAKTQAMERLFQSTNNMGPGGKAHRLTSLFCGSLPAPPWASTQPMSLSLLDGKMGTVAFSYFCSSPKLCIPAGRGAGP